MLRFFTDQKLKEISEFRLCYPQFKDLFKDQETTLNYLSGLVRIKNVTETKLGDLNNLANFKDEALRLHLLILKLKFEL